MSGGERRITRQRRALARVLADSSEFASAQSLHARLQGDGDPIGLATVYRNLQAMAADGEVDVVRTDEGEALYRSCRSQTHHHHLVCRSCGTAVEVGGDPVERWAASVSREHGFREVAHTVELFGTCPTCAP